MIVMSNCRTVHIFGNGLQVFFPSDDEVSFCFTQMFFAVVAFQHVYKVTVFKTNFAPNLGICRSLRTLDYFNRTKTDLVISESFTCAHYVHLFNSLMCRQESGTQSMWTLPGVYVSM